MSVTLNNNVKRKVRRTWSRISLWRTLDNRTAAQTGKHHGCHDLIHLHRFRTTKTGHKNKTNKKNKKKQKQHFRIKKLINTLTPRHARFPALYLYGVSLLAARLLQPRSDFSTKTFWAMAALCANAFTHKTGNNELQQFQTVTVLKHSGCEQRAKKMLPA